MIFLVDIGRLEIRPTNLCELVVLDTREFGKPIAVIKAQADENRVDQL